MFCHRTLVNVLSMDTCCSVVLKIKSRNWSSKLRGHWRYITKSRLNNVTIRSEQFYSKCFDKSTLIRFIHPLQKSEREGWRWGKFTEDSWFWKIGKRPSSARLLEWTWRWVQSSFCFAPKCPPLLIDHLILKNFPSHSLRWKPDEKLNWDSLNEQNPLDP